MSRRQETKDDRRGNARNRRARKLWMLSPVSGFGGDGTKVECVHCGAMLSYETVQADRIIPGGSYRRDNVQPSCGIDNILRANKIGWVAPRLRASATSAA
jgi:hypothetical protein